MESVLDEWRKNKRSKVWLSDTLMTDLNVPLCNENHGSSRVVQAFFLGEGLPAFILTVYNEANFTDQDFQPPDPESQTPGTSSQSEENEKKAKVHKITVSAIKLLRWNLLDFCHCKFVILPLTLNVETLSVASLEEELKLRKRLCRQYYDGDLSLTAVTYKTLVSAAIALQGTSSIPHFFETPQPEVRPPLLLTVFVLIHTCVHR